MTVFPDFGDTSNLRYFNGDEAAVVLVNDQSIYNSIPEELSDYRKYFSQIVNKSIQPRYLTKGQIIEGSMNAFNQKDNPPIFYSPFVYAQAMQFFLVANDFVKYEGTQENLPKTIWQVEADVIYQYIFIVEPPPPCLIDARFLGRGKAIYYGHSPYVERFNSECQWTKTPYLMFHDDDGFPNIINFWVGGDAATTIEGGGYTASGLEFQETSGGVPFVIFPPLPSDIPDPPPLVGVVIDSGPPGPQGPPGEQGQPGPPGQDGIIDADSFVATSCSLAPLQLAAVKECLDIGEAQLTPETLTETFTQLNQTQGETIAENLMLLADNTLMPEPVYNWHGEPPGNFETERDEEGKLRYVLQIPLAEIVTVETENVSVDVYSCNENGVAVAKSVDFPVIKLDGITQAPIYQELFNQLAWLLKCCPPCRPEPWLLFETTQGDRDIYISIPFEAVRLVFQPQSRVEIDNWYNDETINKFGTFRWIYSQERSDPPVFDEERLSELIFWNSFDQAFYPQGLNVRGIRVSQEYNKVYQVWILPVQKTLSGLQI
jgi:hypothetical protein